MISIAVVGGSSGLGRRFCVTFISLGVEYLGIWKNCFVVVQAQYIEEYSCTLR